MCTVVILRRPEHDWPLVLGANRDEMNNRPWAPPLRHWPDRNHVVAGLDVEAGGTWMGVNDAGLVACVLNRYGTLGGHPDFRSRGELPLEALDHDEAKIAAEAFQDLNPKAYRPFNLVVADYLTAWWIKNDGVRMMVVEIQDGVSMLSAHDLNDINSDRIKHHLPRFQTAPTPDPDTDDWMVWQALMGSRQSVGDTRGAMQIETDTGFETVSSSLVALPKPFDEARKLIWKFCAGKPENSEFEIVELT